jgi:hypothetical protein
MPSITFASVQKKEKKVKLCEMNKNTVFRFAEAIWEESVISDECQFYIVISEASDKYGFTTIRSLNGDITRKRDNSTKGIIHNFSVETLNTPNKSTQLGKLNIEDTFQFSGKKHFYRVLELEDKEGRIYVQSFKDEKPFPRDKYTPVILMDVIYRILPN